MVDLGEEKAVAATIVGKFASLLFTNRARGREYITEAKVVIQGYALDTWRSTWICPTWTIKGF